jgi:hypothetical protein
MHGRKNRTKRFPRWFGDRRAFRGLNASLKESLGLVARAGVFIPNGNNNHRSHRDATLLALRKAGAGAADVMLK